MISLVIKSTDSCVNTIGRGPDMTRCLIYVTHDTSYDRVLKILSNGAPHGLFLYIGHHTKAVYKCTISRYVKSRKYGPYMGIYIQI